MWRIRCDEPQLGDKKERSAATGRRLETLGTAVLSERRWSQRATATRFVTRKGQAGDSVETESNQIHAPQRWRQGRECGPFSWGR